MDVKAKVIAVLPIESGTSKSGREWQKQNFVVVVPGPFPKTVCFQLFGERMDECPVVGDEVVVHFDMESHEYNGRWYTQLNAWRVEKTIAGVQTFAPSAAQTASAAQAAYQPLAQPLQPQELPDEDGLPF